MVGIKYNITKPSSLSDAAVTSFTTIDSLYKGLTSYVNAVDEPQWFPQLNTIDDMSACIEFLSSKYNTSETLSGSLSSID